MKRLDLHPITYGIRSLQYTMNGRLASPRYLRGHSQIPHGMVHYVQNTVVENLRGRLWNFCLSASSPLPHHAPASRNWNPVWDNTFWLFDSQVFGLRLPPQPLTRGVDFIYMFLCFSLLTFFWWKKRKRKRKHITVLKYCLTSSVSLCSVCAQDRAELTSASFLLWGEGGETRQCLSSMCLPAVSPSALPTVCLPWKIAWLVKHIQGKKKKKSPFPHQPPLSLCPCVPLATDKEKYELVFLL